MNIDAAFPSKYIRAAELQGRDITLMIARVLQEDVSGDGTERPVIYFNGTEKGLVLNKTNAHTIADALGIETDNWTGAHIVLYATKTDFGGKRVDCIRIREQAPPPAAAPAAVETATAPPSDSEIPF